MKKILLTVLTVLTVLLLSGCSALSPQVQCAENFTFTDSFMAGRTYKTAAIVPNITKKDAVDRLSILFSEGRWQITSKDTESGFISASLRAGYDQEEVVPLGFLHAIVEQRNKDVEISITYATSGGVTSSSDAIIKQFCPIVADVEKKRLVIDSYNSFEMVRDTLFFLVPFFYI